MGISLRYFCLSRWRLKHLKQNVRLDLGVEEQIMAFDYIKKPIFIESNEIL